MKFKLLIGHAYAPGLDVAEALVFIERLVKLEEAAQAVADLSTQWSCR